MKKIITKGFSLVELAIIILILGLITVLLWRFIEARIQQQHQVTTRTLLEQADDALTGFVLAHDRLPCPSADENGEENCAAQKQIGYFPFKTIGLADIRSRQIRYGVLRRDTNDADLTVAKDRFTPLLLAGNSNISALKMYLETNMPVAQAIHLGNANTIDFCYMLRTADTLPDSDAYLHVVQQNNRRNIAYALALPGAMDASGNGLLLDGVQLSLSGFNRPQEARTFIYDDVVRAVSFNVLWHRLGCTETLAAAGHGHPNAETAAAMLYRGLYDYAFILEQVTHLADSQRLMAISGVLSAAASMVDAASATLNAAGDVQLKGDVSSMTAALTLLGISALTSTALMGTSIAGLIQAVDVYNISLVRRDNLGKMLPTAIDLTESIYKNVQCADDAGVYRGDIASCP